MMNDDGWRRRDYSARVAPALPIDADLVLNVYQVP